MKKDTTTLLDRLGGNAALDAAIEELYFRLVCDEELLVFFEGVDLALLKAHQTRFMRLAFTKIPPNVDVCEMIARAHGRLFRMGLSAEHFDMVAAHLVETLQVLGISQELIDEVVAVVGPLRAVFEEYSLTTTSATPDNK